MAVFQLSAEGRNVLFNSDFQMGTSGFALVRALRPDCNPELKYRPLRLGTDLNAGKRYLSVENPDGEAFRLVSREFRLPAGTEVSFQAKMRGGQPGAEEIRLSILSVTPSNQWKNFACNFRLTQEWRSCSYTFRTGDTAEYYTLRFLAPAGKMLKGRFEIADIRLTASGLEPNELEIAAVPEKRLIFYPEMKELGVTLKVVNRSKRSFSGGIELTVGDTSGFRSPDRLRVSAALEPGKAGEFHTKIPVSRFGAFEICPSVSGWKTDCLNGMFTVAGQVAGKKEFHPDSIVGFAINSGANSFWDPVAKSVAYWAENAPPEERIALLAAGGCRLIRDHDSGFKSTSWALMEPENGKFDFSHFDRARSLMEKYGIEFLPCFGRMVERRMPYEVENSPAWLKPLLKRVPKNPSGVRKTLKVELPPVNLWSRYVSAFATRAKGKIRYYEVMNEPNLSISPENYMIYLSSAYRAIKAADPAAKVVGLCVTGDHDGNIRQFTERAVRSGALEYLDIASFHPYNARELNSLFPADRQIFELRSMLPGKTLWNTELYYLFDMEQDETRRQIDCSPEDIACRFLTDSGENVAQSVLLHEDQLWRHPLNPHLYSSRDRRTELVANDCFVMCNTLARLFNGAVAEEKIRLSNGIVCYLFRRDGERIAAVWNSRKTDGCFADFSGFAVLDLFGNPIPDGEKLLSRTVYFLKKGPLSDPEFRRRLQNLPIRLEQPLRVSQTARLLNDRLLVGLHNLGTETVHGAAGFSGDGLASVYPVPFECPGNSGVLLEFLVERSGLSRGKPEVLFYTDKNKGKSAVRIRNNPVVRTGEVIRLAGNDPQFSADCVVRRNGERLIVDLTVRDPSNAGVTGSRKPWETDSAELFFDFSPDSLPLLHTDSYTSDVVRLFITPRDPVGMQLTAWGIDRNSVSSVVSLLPDGYSIRCSLPLPKRSGRLGFEVKVNNAAENSIRSICWTGREDSFRDRCGFGIIELEPRTEGGTENRIPSGNFESAALDRGWKPVHYLNHFPGSIVEGNAPFSGKRSLKLLLSPEYKAAVTSPRFAVAPGKRYELCFMAKGKAGTQLRATLNCWSPVAHKGEHLYRNRDFKLSGAWRFCRLPAFLPADTVRYPDLLDGSAYVQFTVQRGDGAVWIDDVMLMER